MTRQNYYSQMSVDELVCAAAKAKKGKNMNRSSQSIAEKSVQAGGDRHGAATWKCIPIMRIAFRAENAMCAQEQSST